MDQIDDALLESAAREAADALEAMSLEDALRMLIGGGMFSGRCADPAVARFGELTLAALDEESAACLIRASDSTWFMEVRAGSYVEQLRAAGLDPEEVRAVYLRVLFGPGSSAEDETFLDELGFRLLTANRRLADPETVRTWIDHLSHADARRRMFACRVVGALQPVAALEPLMARLTDDPDPLVRRHACHALGGLGGAAAPALGLLSRALHDPGDCFLRLSAADALRRIGSAAGELGSARVLTSVVGELLDHDVSEVRQAAVWALASFGAAAAHCLNGLARVLEDQEEAEETRTWVLTVLREIGPPAVPVLTRALDDLLPVVRAGATSVLGELGPPAREAVARLRLLTQEDPDDAVRECAAAALELIEAPPAGLA